jgi:hypothetical protein
VKTIQALEAEQLPLKISSVNFSAVKPSGQEQKVKQVELAVTVMQIVR